ncbi:siderophore biosynthesis protein SbnG [Bacillaceae bacterium JMAK1]|nr:siderophore biosynthesis protein SbnG [Bacillaceae bacterium JMAK1]
MRANLLKQKIARNEKVFGMFVSTPHPTMVELLGYAEFDFVIIDHEHASSSKEMIENMIRAAEVTGTTPLVRLAEVNRQDILKVLDAGAAGIVIANVKTKEEVEQAVQHTFYHPKGMRSLNSGRPGQFGKHSLTEYIATVNEELMLIPMIESVEGVEQREAIVSCSHIDFVLEGTADLSQSLHVPWQLDHPDVEDHVEQLFESTKRANIPYAIVSRNETHHQQWSEKGVSIFVLGDERGNAFRAFQAKLNHYRSLARGKSDE